MKSGWSDCSRCPLAFIDKLALEKIVHKSQVFWANLTCFLGYFLGICQWFPVKVPGKKFGIFSINKPLIGFDEEVLIFCSRFLILNDWLTQRCRDIKSVRTGIEVVLCTCWNTSSVRSDIFRPFQNMRLLEMDSVSIWVLSMNQCRFWFGQFSLTPALSRWERGNRRPMVWNDER